VCEAYCRAAPPEHLGARRVHPGTG
jgi:hypothetical protein